MGQKPVMDRNGLRTLQAPRYGPLRNIEMSLGIETDISHLISILTVLLNLQQKELGFCMQECFAKNADASLFSIRNTRRPNQ